MAEPLCPICDRVDGVEVRHSGGFELNSVSCPHCGKFEVTFEAVVTLPNLDQERRGRIAGYARQASLEFARRLRAAPLRVTLEALQTLPQDAPLDVLDRLDRLNLNLAHSGDHAGAFFPLDPNTDSPLGYCANPKNSISSSDNCTRRVSSRATRRCGPTQTSPRCGASPSLVGSGCESSKPHPSPRGRRSSR